MFENLSSEKTLTVACVVIAVILRTFFRTRKMSNAVRWVVIGFVSVLLTIAFLGLDMPLRSKTVFIVGSIAVLITAEIYVNKFQSVNKDTDPN